MAILSVESILKGKTVKRHSADINQTYNTRTPTHNIQKQIKSSQPAALVSEDHGTKNAHTSVLKEVIVRLRRSVGSAL